MLRGLEHEHSSQAMSCRLFPCPSSRRSSIDSRSFPPHTHTRTKKPSRFVHAGRFVALRGAICGAGRQLGNLLLSYGGERGPCGQSVPDSGRIGTSRMVRHAVCVLRVLGPIAVVKRILVLSSVITKVICSSGQMRARDRSPGLMESGM